MSEISIHNSKSELTVTPQWVDDAGFQPFTFTGSDGGTLPYRQLVANEELPGKFSLMIFFHGAGSVGTDNFLQMRIPGPPFLRYVRKHALKTILLFPQCRMGCQWVDVPWSDKEHVLPEKPSFHMNLAMELLKEKIAGFQPDPDRIYAGGISMGGYGAWDMVSRLPDTFAAVFPICGGADVRQAAKLRRLAVCAYHGEVDSVVPVSRARDMVAALHAQGDTRILYRELPGVDHNAWDPAFSDESALDFIFHQTRE